MINRYNLTELKDMNKKELISIIKTQRIMLLKNKEIAKQISIDVKILEK